MVDKDLTFPLPFVYLGSSTELTGNLVETLRKQLEELDVVDDSIDARFGPIGHQVQGNYGPNNYCYGVLNFHVSYDASKAEISDLSRKVGHLFKEHVIPRLPHDKFIVIDALYYTGLQRLMNSQCISGWMQALQGIAYAAGQAGPKK